MAKALLVALWLITAICLGLFWFHPWWLPVLASTQGEAVDRQFKLTFILVGIAFLLAQGALGFLIWKYNAVRNQTPGQSFVENKNAELFWTALTSLLFLAFAWTGTRSWSESHATHTPADAKLPVDIEVTGMQFA